MIIFDEKIYAEAMLKKGFLTQNKNVYELIILSKYLLHLGKNTEQIKQDIINFCEKYMSYYNKDSWGKTIESVIDKSKKYPLIHDKEILITQNELSKINSINNINKEKIVFVLLVIYKFYGYKKFRINREEMFRLAQVKVNYNAKIKILKELTKNNFINIDDNGRRSISFAEKEDIYIIIINNFNDFILEYLKWKGESIKYCKVCGKPIKLVIPNSKAKYCNDCAKDIQFNQKKEWDKNRRKH